MLGKLFRGLSSLIVVLSALNVGIIGITGDKVNPLARLLGESSRIAYIVIGIAGVISLLGIFRCCCPKKKASGCCQGHDHCDHKN